MIEESSESNPLINQEFDTLIRMDQRKRIQTFDLARGLAILFMIMQHVVLIYGNLGVTSSFIGLFILSLGTLPAAPVFLFLMGACFKYSDRDDYELFRYGLTRGLKLVLLGYGLNFLRFSVPLLIGLKELELNLYEVDDSIHLTFLSSLFLIDILHCAGLSLIVMGIAVRLLKRERAYILLAVCILLISPLVWGKTSSLILIDFCLTLLWGTGSEVFFPLFPWCVYPLLGMAFGQRLRSGIEIGRLISLSRNIGVGLFVVSLIIALRNIGREIFVVGKLINFINPLFRFSGYEHPGPVAVILTIGFILVWIWLCELIVKKSSQNRLYGILFFWSKNVTVFYFFQWILIGWGMLLLGYQTQNLLITLLLIGLFLFLTHILVDLYEQKKTQYTKFFPL